ncbi:MAG: tetrahydrofolate dehydrogenase/cyclohydrolase catalytic domain-containing protein, partial [Terriglobia bacterium]
MSARILKGTTIAGQIKDDLRAEIAALKQAGVTPGLAAVLVGDNPGSHIYVRNKMRACEELGLHSELLTPPASVTTEQLLAEVGRLNQRTDIDAILVQLPLPPQVEAQRVLLAVDPAKDVDGFHPMNVGALVTQ